MSNLYARRVEQEWRLLGLLAGANPEQVREIGRVKHEGDEAFSLTLEGTCGLLREAPERLVTIETHSVLFIFRRFFPSVPIEGVLRRPVFHPNVHRETGFVCLWHRFSPGDTVIDAVRRLQRVITWELVNDRANHVMQPDALAWLRQRNRSHILPLHGARVSTPEGFELDRTYASLQPRGYRRRLFDKKSE